jgi:inward rectifier potassium channel
MKTRLRRNQRIVRIENRDGKLVIHGMGKWYHHWRDPYHLLLTIPWIGFVGIISVAYLLLNILFALAYLAGGDCLEGAKPGIFGDAFFFSVQTLASIGYGAIYPKTLYANAIVAIEAIASLLLIAVVTGLAFARFSRPIAKVLFSQFAVVTNENLQPTLMFRVANERHNFILEANAQAYFICDELTNEGSFFRRIHELKLLRHRNPNLVLSWTIMHPLDTDSPLYGLTATDLAQRQANISVSITGVDETVAYPINARHSYDAEEILFNHQFEDTILRSDNGDRYFDYSRFHHVKPYEERNKK